MMYPELRRHAASILRHEPLGYLWSPAALINEAYTRIVTMHRREWQQLENPIALWRRIMRHVLIDHGRSFRTQKRNCGNREVSLEDTQPASEDNLDTTLALKMALQKLSAEDRRQGLVINLHFRYGLTLDETATVLRVSPRTVKRVLRCACTQLRKQLA